MARGKKKKSNLPSPGETVSASIAGKAVVNTSPSNGHGNDLVVKPVEASASQEMRTQAAKDQAMGCCAVATDADCVTVKSTVTSAKCDFCAEPSTGRIFVFKQGLELRQGYEKDACKTHRALSGGPMP